MNFAQKNYKYEILYFVQVLITSKTFLGPLTEELFRINFRVFLC